MKNLTQKAQKKSQIEYITILYNNKSIILLC